MKNKCNFCKKEIKKKKRYCNKECLKASRDLYIKDNTFNCAFCQNKVYRPPSHREKVKHGRFFCTQSCSASFNNTGKQKNKPKERICVNCNKVYFFVWKENRSRYCSECFVPPNDYKLVSLKTFREKPYIKRRHPSWAYSHLRVLNRTWNKHLSIFPCQNCNYTKHIEFCHIKPISSYSEDTLLGEINHESNILILCPNCHWEFDHEKLNIENIPKRNGASVESRTLSRQ